MTFYIQYAVLGYRQLFATWSKIQLALKCFWGPLAQSEVLERLSEMIQKREREEERSFRFKECEWF